MKLFHKEKVEKPVKPECKKLFRGHEYDLVVYKKDGEDGFGKKVKIGTPKEIGVICKDNPYSSLGQMNVCWLRVCKFCGEAEASQVQNNEANGVWNKVIGYTGGDKRIDQGRSEGFLDSFIGKGTPMVEDLREHEDTY